MAYDNKCYQTSTISAIFCIEESQKGFTFMENIFRNTDMPNIEYNKLSKHHVKCVKSIDMIIKADKDILSGKFFEHSKYYNAMTDAGLSPTSPKQQSELKKIFSNLPKLRSYCTYTDWNNYEKIWSNYNITLDQSSQRNLSIYLLCISTSLLYNLKDLIHEHVAEIKWIQNLINE